MLNIYKKIQTGFKNVINIYEILVFSELLADLDDAVQLCPTLRIQFFDVKLR